MQSFKVVILFVCIVPSYAWWRSDPRVDPHEEVQDECLRYAAWGRCEFYECLERRFPCGHSGFTLHVGLHLCRKITNKMSEFTTEGRQWMNRTSVCLTNSLLPVYRSYASRCGDIKNDGAEGMLQCNSRTDSDGQDFCSFVQDNSETYQSMLGVDELTRIARLRNPRVMARLFVDGARCGADALMDRFHAFTGSFNELIGSFLDRWEGLTERWNQIWN